VNKVALISFSGGIDSTSLLLHLLSNNYKIYALTFDYGQKHKIEIQKAKKNINYLKDCNYNVEHTIIDLSDCVNILKSSLTNHNQDVPTGYYEEKNMLSTVVPNRNAIFTSILYGYALTLTKENNSTIINLSLGVHSGDHAIYPDCRIEFYEHIIDSFKLGNWNTDNIKLYLPYINIDKSQILQDAITSIEKLNLNFNTIFKNTITSYNPTKQGLSDGNTGSDIERILAFDKLGLKDPLKYNFSWDIVLSNAKNVEEKYKRTKIK